MILIDINVLIYAHRADSPEHTRYAQWLSEVAGSPSPFGLSDFVLTGFLRIVTNRRIFPKPTPRGLALAFLRNLLDCRNAVLILPTSNQWSLVAELCEQVDISGPLVSDAYLAALAIDHGCELITTDSDFSRFPRLRWRHPLSCA